MEVNPISFIEVIEEHLYLRPEMQVQDVYKLLFQGVRGPEHLISSLSAFKENLAQEWDTLDKAGIDPLTETIRPDGNLLRLNLHPYMAGGGELELLISVCLETADRHWGTRIDLENVWSDFSAAYQNGVFPGFPVDEIREFTSWLSAHQFPPVHHSEKYRNLYRPAYRLIAADLLSRLSC